MPAQLWLEIRVAGFAALAAIFWAICGAAFVPPDRAGIDYNAPQSVVSELQRSVKKQSHWNKRAAWMACASAALQVAATVVHVISAPPIPSDKTTEAPRRLSQSEFPINP